MAYILNPDEIVPNADMRDQPLSVLRAVYGDPPPIETAPTRAVKVAPDAMWPLGDPALYLPKGRDFTCLRCGSGMSIHDKRCECGKKNPGFKEKAKMTRKQIRKRYKADQRAQKALYRQSRSEFWAFAAAAPAPTAAIKSRWDAERHLLESYRADPDPVVRLAAEAALKKAQ